ncbi:transcription factor S-II [Cooperia oncophora]
MYRHALKRGTVTPLVTNERCPKCSNDRAYFMQIQTRSADEPMTIFYRCANADCGHRWKD